MSKLLRKNWFCYALIGLFTLLLWGRTVGFDFVWDDQFLIVKNTHIRSLRNIPEIFTSLLPQSADVAPSYRPTRTAFYALLYAIDGHDRARPWIFHLSNVLWHAGAAMLLFSVALLLWQRLMGEATFAGRIAALLAALGFVADPVVSEAVCWVKCLDDLIGTVFVLASLRALLLWNGGKGRFMAALFFYLVAAFSKESAAPFAAVVFVVFLGFHKFSWQRSALLTVPFVAVGLYYIAWRQGVLGQAEECPPLSGSYGQTLIDMFPVVAKYLRLLWGIPPFIVDYNYMVGAPHHHFFSVAVLTGVLLILAFAATAAWLWRFENWRMVSFGIWWIALFLLPVSNLVPMMQYMAERFLYLPLVGFLLALAQLGLNLPRRGLAGAGAGVLIALWAACSMERMGVWHDEVELFVQTSLAHPESWRPRENAIVSIFALPQISPFFRLDPDTHQLMALNPPREADAAAMLNTLTGAHNIFPNEHRFTAALGVAYAQRGQMSNAVTWLELAAHQKTNDVSCWIDLASAYARLTNWTAARAALESALRVSPTNRLVQERLRELKSN